LSIFDTYFSLFKCVIGTGILAMPLSFMYTGILGGFVFTIVIMFVIIYGMELLIMCMVESSRRNKLPYMTYPQTIAFAIQQGPQCCHWFSKASSILVDVILGLSHYMINVVYIVFVALNLRQFVEEYWCAIDLRLLIAIVGVCCIPLFIIRHLKYLVPANIIATFLILGGLLAIFWYLFRGLPSISDRDLFPNWIKIPFALGIIIFSSSSVGVASATMLAIESKMAEPKKYLGWLGVLSIAAIIICILYIFFGLMGFWRFGDETEATVTLNIPVDEILAQIIKLAIAVAIFLSYPLSGYVPINIIMDHLKRREIKNPIMIEYIVRICFVLVGTINGIAFPNLGPLLALVGTFSISLLNLIFPCCIELCLIYNDSFGKFLWKLWKNIAIIVFGAIIFLYGSYDAIREMINEYFTKSDDKTTEDDTTEAATIATA
ncbi:hypothetical protein KR044_006864, partial [Drosophila immigrans]